VDGAEDLGFGLKLSLTRNEGVVPDLAVIIEGTAPTGGKGFTSNEVNGGINFCYRWKLLDRLTLGGSSGYNAVTRTRDHFHEFHQSMLTEFALTQDLGAYLEWFAVFFHRPGDGAPEHYANAGLAYHLTRDLQLDCRLGFGLNERSDDFFVGTGLTFRY
jgi:hypothetical protein